MDIFKKLLGKQKNAQDDINANFEKVYPIGNVIINVLSTYDPNVSLGGKWERYAKGKTLIGVDDSDTDFKTVGKTGGAKIHKHDLGNGTAFAQMKITSGNISTKNVDNSSSWAITTKNTSAMTFSDGTGMQSGGVNVVGETPESSNLMPYITTYMWVRIA